MRETAVHVAETAAWDRLDAGRRLVVADHLGHDEGEELLGELGVQLGLRGQGPESGDLLRLALRVGGRQAVRGLELTTCWVILNRSASRWTRAASMLSMLPRSRGSSAIASAFMI